MFIEKRHEEKMSNRKAEVDFIEMLVYSI